MPTVIVTTAIPPEDRARLERVVLALHDAPKDVRQECTKGLRRAVRPMQRTFRAGALGFLPLRGGLAELVAADMRFRSSVSVGPSPRLRITAQLPGHDLPPLTRGRIRHPVYGNRGRWVNQFASRADGWWDKSGTVGAQEVLPELQRAVDVAADRLELTV